ncbi:DNA polymerase III, clamp loader complex, gamma/delta/delta subunit, C-terminal,AAA+ ATPase domain,P- [Cinara cedri]|uniref:DNA polymerase III, clamp loader complex, gamma/delta/delta subunit, C-terminal,AAA+ ATPase domain,P n=1 Tax=Cinara cedri TaxID=506608 RepID=A0A5E4NEI7_9HEMI|nr:DNA polymerase III, clamp loader complex, gamma/delta/delta subunit, C-terminal,AAA+ ATPase domain,P- [Cinara cedri]
MDSFLKTGKINQDQQSTSSGIKNKNDFRGISDSTTPWVEKYRPRTVDEVSEQSEIVAVLKQCLEQGADMPHLLFYGPPGTGKTSTIIAAARQLFGDMYKDRMLELNASDDRGIQVIRDKVKTFAQLTASDRRADGRPCPPFKIVVLDEADSMTAPAQAALRRTIERETKTTRFCLICNYVSCIIDPLTSRCSKFRFKPLSQNVMLSRLEHICKEEGVMCVPRVLARLVDASGGDMRRVITSLQSTARLKGEEGIEEADVLEVVGTVPDIWLDRMLEMGRTYNYQKMDSFVEELIFEAYSAAQVLEQFHDKIVFAVDLKDKEKALICKSISICAYRLQEGCSEYVTLLHLLCSVAKALKN